MINIKCKIHNFSLIEVLVALTIIAVCFTVLMSALTVNINNTAISRNYVIACMLAQKKLTELSNDDKIKAGDELGDFGDYYPTFNWETKIKKKSKYLYSIKLLVSFTRNNEKRYLWFKAIQLNQEALKKKDKDKDKDQDKDKDKDQSQNADQSQPNT